ncbi:Hypothetical predicted protein [Paramuricea clavata]|uniref:Uncharacterized protein n=1 Tax=Paramuricea clavata TaxID=317549 RepID=A0A7D9HPR1_PARCT|nr:Hypothetical predicted protein [Paramuricea clavata]
MSIFSDLYINFTQFQPPFPCNSFAEKFTLWKRFYDEYKATEQQIIHTDLFNMPAKDPTPTKTLTYTTTRSVAKINGKNDKVFQNFILQNETPTETKNDSVQIQPAETSSCSEQNNPNASLNTTSAMPKVQETIRETTTTHNCQFAKCNY